jgi:hypothetical protein
MWTCRARMHCAGRLAGRIRRTERDRSPGVVLASVGTRRASCPATAGGGRWRSLTAAIHGGSQVPDPDAPLAVEIAWIHGGAQPNACTRLAQPRHRRSRWEMFLARLEERSRRADSGAWPEQVPMRPTTVFLDRRGGALLVGRRVMRSTAEPVGRMHGEPERGRVASWRPDRPTMDRLPRNRTKPGTGAAACGSAGATGRERW